MPPLAPAAPRCSHKRVTESSTKILSPFGIHSSPPDFSTRTESLETVEGGNGTNGAGAAETEELFSSEYEHEHEYNGTVAVTPEMASKAKLSAEG